jgi:hypothetical protein
MYMTIQQACRQAIRAHVKEQRQHVVFKEMGLWRVRPVDEIAEIDQQAVYGWTQGSSRYVVYEGESIWEARDRRAQPWAVVRRQFYKGSCYFDPQNALKGLTIRNRLTDAQIRHNLICGQF